MNYFEKQLYSITPFPLEKQGLNGQIKMKMTASGGGGRQTQWVNLSPEQFRAIEKLVMFDPIFNDNQSE